MTPASALSEPVIVDRVTRSPSSSAERNSDSSVQEIAQAFRDLNVEHDFLRLFGQPKLTDQGTLSCSRNERGKVFASEAKRFRFLARRP